jgi:hypothetical protein
VIVGAGPTGVEFTSELRDWLEVEGRRYYGKLLKYVKITLVEAVFDAALQKEAMQRLTGICSNTPILIRKYAYTHILIRIYAHMFIPSPTHTPAPMHTSPLTTLCVSLCLYYVCVSVPQLGKPPW